jgi:hypothetical protein
MQSRADWLEALLAICAPVLEYGAAGTLKKAMPVEAPINPEQRRPFSHLEACGRTLAGLAPWLELAGLEGREAELQDAARQQARQLIASITDPASPDYLNFSQGLQPVVDAAYLAQAIMRAPHVLWNGLSNDVKANVLRAFGATRRIKPWRNNWLLFSAMIEAFFCAVGADFDRMRIDYAIHQMEQWYVGDGFYSDGDTFHFDYYNSYVIHPFLLDILRVTQRERHWVELYPPALVRAQRYAVVLERMISPEGAMPMVGRSLSYRCGNLHALAHLALLKLLPDTLPPGQVREAIAAVAFRSLSAPRTLDAEGWLAVGFFGQQPSLAEHYISTGSLYMCTLAFMPLGLSADDPFWQGPGVPTTSERIYGGVDMSADHALRE